MSCFFCESEFHVSHNCDKYATDELRQNIISTKKSCSNCFKFLADEFNCTKCKYTRKCFICFSKMHPTIFCPDRFLTPYSFPPKIDSDLLFRFGLLLNPEEKWSMVFSYPSLFDIFKFMPIKIQFSETCYYSFIEPYMCYDLIQANKCEVIGGTANRIDPSNMQILNLPFFHIKYLEIRSLEIFASEFLLLLSSKTIRIKCCCAIRISHELNFHEILKKAPYLQDIDIYQTKVKVENSWPEDILCYNSATNLRYLILAIPDLNCNVQNLITLLKKTSVKIYAYITVSNYGEVNEGLTAANNKFSPFFVPRLHWQNDARIFFIFRIGRTYGSYHYDCYALAEK